MPLLNYTTQIDAGKSVNEIQKALSKVGARRVLHDYDDNGYITSLSFEIMLNDSPIAFRLPTDWRPILEVLKQDNRVPRRLVTQEQAMRVAWRITKDWVEAQAAFIETQMVTTAQVFLPYAVTNDGRSMYQYIAENSQILIGSGNE